jgi:hydrogenase-4 component F
MLGHGLAKGSLFVSAGRLLQVTGTSRIDRVHGLAGRLPLLAGCAGAGVLALTGFPPFSIFASEIGIARAGFSAGLGWITALALALMLVITAALLGHTGRMLLGTGPPADGTPHGTAAGHGTGAPATARSHAAGLAPVIAALAACAVLGIYAGPLAGLLHSAARTLTVTP